MNIENLIILLELKSLGIVFLTHKKSQFNYISNTYLISICVEERMGRVTGLEDDIGVVYNVPEKLQHSNNSWHNSEIF